MNILTFLTQLTNFNLALPPSPTLDDIRDHLDDLVKDPSAPSAAFLLIRDYQRLLYKDEQFCNLSRRPHRTKPLWW
ncbi:MAG: hypothetical protein ACK5ZJ_08395 [Acidobacteriota bacterium]